MDIQQRLDFLKKMLNDYEKANYNTTEGFCYYLSNNQKIDFYEKNLILDDLIFSAKRQGIDCEFGVYWYEKKGATAERIKTIELLIKILKDRIKSNVLFYEDLTTDSKKIAINLYYKNHENSDVFLMKRLYNFDKDGNLLWKSKG